MKYLALIGFGTGATLLATDPLPSIPGATEVGALGVLGWAVWYMLSKSVPNLLKAHREERTEDRTEHLAAQADAREDFREQLARVVKYVDTVSVEQKK